MKLPFSSLTLGRRFVVGSILAAAIAVASLGATAPPPADAGQCCCGPACGCTDCSNCCVNGVCHMKGSDCCGSGATCAACCK